MCNEAYRLLAFYNSNESSASTHICKLPSRYNLAYSSGSSTASEVNAKHSVSTTLFQMIRSKIFISDCVVFFDTIATFVQTIAGWIVLTGKNVAQISDEISNPVIAGIIYWLIRILICGGCLVGAGILVAFIGIKIAELYKKCCWDMITILVILISMAIAIYFEDWIKTVLSINMLFLLLFVQLVYVGIRWYVKGWRETRGYH